MRSAWLMVIVGCSNGSPAVPGDVAPDTGHQDASANDGTRLKIEWNTLEDTWVPEPRRFNDSALGSAPGIECGPLRWADGVVRCTPLEPTAQYGDAACTQPLPVAKHTGDNPAIKPYFVVAETWVDGELRATGVVRADQELSASTPRYIPTPAGGCIAAPSGPYTVFAAGDALGPDDFVVLESPDPGGARLDPSELTGADGMHVRLGMFDHEMDQPCNLAPTSDGGGLGCTPSTTWPMGQYFADATCATPAMVATRPIVLVDQTTACPSYVRTAYDPAAPVLYTSSDSTCTATPFTGAVYSAIAPLVLATASRVVDPASGSRYQHIFTSTAAGSIETELVHDTVLDVDCRLVTDRSNLASPVSCTAVAALPPGC